MSFAGPRRGDHASAASAAVLLPAVADEAEAPLDDVDLLGVLVLLGPGLECPATLRAGGHRIGGRVHDVHPRQRGLRPRPVPARGCGRARRLLARGAAAPFRGAAEERPRAGRELLLEPRNLELELGMGRARGLGQRPAEFHQPPMEPRVLRFEQQRHLPQPLEVRLRCQPHHRGFADITPLAYCQAGAAARGLHVRGVTAPGESAVRVSSVHPSRKRLSSLSVSVRPPAAAPAGAHSAANRPCSSRL